MANKKNKGNAPKPVQPVSPVSAKKAEPVVVKEATPSFDLNFGNKYLNNPYLPGLVLFLIALIIGIVTNKDYGICWDEFYQRRTAMVTWDYVFNHKNDLLTYMDRQYGVGFELPLIFIEKCFKLTQLKDIYAMRHMVTHIFFLCSAFAGYALVYRLFKNKIMAMLGFIMLAFSPRLYAHSYFNTKDIPFLCVFLITLMFAQIAFEKDRKWYYFVLGLLCGYTTSIRIMGIMLAGFILFFLFIDWISKLSKNNKPKEAIVNMLIFPAGFCLSLYVAWPYLWTSPIDHFIESYDRMSHFFLETKILTAGEQLPSLNLPSDYVPIWFGVTNPVLWLFAGLAGLVWVLVSFLQKPASFLRNTNERNFVLFGLCFAMPIIAVISLHSVLYDDWRQLYFVYPSFVMLALYCIYKLYQSALRWLIIGACLVQICMVGFFMTKYHPFQQVYFNELVSHEPEYLRKNYELDYWGPSFKQSLDYLLNKYPNKTIKITCNPAVVDPLLNNVQVRDSADQKRIQVLPQDKADYFIANFRFHPDDYPSNNIETNITVLNSTIIRIYKLHD